MARNFSSIASVKTLASNVTTSATTVALNNLTGLPTPPYTLVLNPDTSIEEIITVNSVASGTTLNVSRAQEGTTAQAHSTGNSVRHMVTGRDLQEPQDHIANTTTAHGVTGAVVGTTSTQTLTNKTVNLSSNTLTGTKAQFNTAMSDDDFATLTGTEVLTNKTVRDSTFFISDDVDTTKKLQFQVSGLTTATTRTLTVPDISGTIVTTADTGSVSTNMIAASAITSAKIADATIVDADISGTAAIAWSKLAADTNYVYTNPTGMLAPYAGSTAPSGWLLCDGSAISRTTYSALYTALGGAASPYGQGDGSSTFNIPDLRGRVIAGTDNMGTTQGDGGRLDWANTLGTSGGAQTHTLAWGEMPSHNHTWSYYDAASNTGDNANSGARWDNSSDTAENLVTITTSSSGSNLAHNNMQPTILLNYIIKF